MCVCAEYEWRQTEKEAQNMHNNKLLYGSMCQVLGMCQFEALQMYQLI